MRFLWFFCLMGRWKTVDQRNKTNLSKCHLDFGWVGCHNKREFLRRHRGCFSVNRTICQSILFTNGWVFSFFFYILTTCTRHECSFGWSMAAEEMSCSSIDQIIIENETTRNWSRGSESSKRDSFARSHNSKRNLSCLYSSLFTENCFDVSIFNSNLVQFSRPIFFSPDDVRKRRSHSASSEEKKRMYRHVSSQHPTPSRRMPSYKSKSNMPVNDMAISSSSVFAYCMLYVKANVAYLNLDWNDMMKEESL